jgi:fission 1 protein
MVNSASTSTDKLPYAADISLGLSPEELAVLREQYQNEQAKGWISTQTKFNLAWGLVKGNVRQGQVSEGIAILMGTYIKNSTVMLYSPLIHFGLLVDVYRTDSNRRRECLYYLSLGHYKLGNYTEAKRFNGMFTFAQDMTMNVVNK